MEIDAIPPFHWQPAASRSLPDAVLTENPELGVGAGVWETK